MHTSTVEVEGEGVCIRFCPLETAHSEIILLSVSVKNIYLATLALTIRSDLYNVKKCSANVMNTTHIFFNCSL